MSDFLAAHDLEGMESWRRQHLEMAADLFADLDDLDDHREKRLTVDLIGKLVRLAYTVSPSSASEAGRALVAHRYNKEDYADVIRLVEES